MADRVLLTHKVVEAAQAPAAGQAFIRDDRILGFALRIAAGGVKSFVVEGRVRGRFRRFTLGQYPRLNVPTARKQAKQKLAAFA